MAQQQRIEADYLIETAFDPARAAEAMAGEQSSGTFVPVPGETAELKADLIYAAGGGILAHPMGPAAGVASLQQAWSAAVLGRPLDEHARDHPELARALQG